MLVAGNEGSVSSLSSPVGAQWAAMYRDEKQVPNATVENTFPMVIQISCYLAQGLIFFNCFLKPKSKDVIVNFFDLGWKQWSTCDPSSHIIAFVCA